MMQNSNFKRLMAVALSVLMMLTAIPFSAAAADETTPEYVALGTYSKTTLVWQVLGKTTDGDYILISKDVIAKSKFGGKDYATAPIFETLNTTFFGAAFTEAEQSYLKDRTVTYSTNAAQATVTGKVTLPSVADQETYNLGKANLLGSTTATEYWLADQNAKAIQIKTVTATGTVSQKPNTTTTIGYRAMIVLDGSKIVSLTKTENVTYTTAQGTEITAAAIGTGFKVVLDASCSQSAITVKANGTAIEAAAGGVYTASASPITVEGVVLNPADYTAYNAAVAKTADLEEDDYTAESWAALQAALAEDVANLTINDQYKVNAATAAIEAAIAALADAPADFTEYGKAIAQAKIYLADEATYDLTGIVPNRFNNYKYYLNQAVKNEAKIRACTKKEQATVDEAVAEITMLNEGVGIKPAKIDAWKKAVAVRNDLNKEFYEADYVDAVNAIIDQVVAEQNFEVDRPPITEQDYVDAQTKKMTDVIGNKDDHYLPADFSALDAALERAATYLEENYYKDEDVKREEELGGTAAWEQFAAMKEAAERVEASKANKPTKKAFQKQVDEAVENLTKAMDGLDPYIRLGKWDRFVKDANYFFSDMRYNFESFIGLLKTLAGLIKMLINGEIDLYGLFELLGVDQEVLDILIKIGITPKPDIEEPETPADPETPVA